jgi:hypothetical protein
MTKLNTCDESESYLCSISVYVILPGVVVWRVGRVHHHQDVDLFFGNGIQDLRQRKQKIWSQRGTEREKMYGSYQWTDDRYEHTCYHSGNENTIHAMLFVLEPPERDTAKARGLFTQRVEALSTGCCAIFAAPFNIIIHDLHNTTNGDSPVTSKQNDDTPSERSSSPKLTVWVLHILSGSVSRLNSGLVCSSVSGSFVISTYDQVAASFITLQV